MRIDVRNFTEEQQEQFIRGFETLIKEDDYDTDYPIACVWTYDDYIEIKEQNIGDYYEMGRDYALQMIPEVIETILQEETTTLNNKGNDYLEIMDNNTLARNNQPLLSNIIFLLTDKTKKIIKEYDPDIDDSEISYIGAKDGLAVNTIDKNNMICYNDNNLKIDLEELNCSKFLEKLTELATQMRADYLSLSEDYDFEELSSTQNTICASDVDNELKFRKTNHRGR